MKNLKNLHHSGHFPPNYSSTWVVRHKTIQGKNHYYCKNCFTLLANVVKRFPQKIQGKKFHLTDSKTHVTGIIMMRNVFTVCN